ncbi:MAG TPA: hypothetical protein VF525_15655 [Pyrinomonadaceae bacterium]|jgi:FlaG/FlaF family flagellin (archaellin)
MRNSHADQQRTARRLVLSIAAFCVCAALPLLSSARSPSASINVVNSSSREIIHIYLAHIDQDDWGVNQLGDASILPGQTFSIANVACDETQIKVVAEDKDGCFLTSVAACGDNGTATITNDTPRDCGGN